jgi:hypothetical protein
MKSALDKLPVHKLSYELVWHTEETSCILTHTQWRSYPNIPYHSASLAHTQSHILLTWTPSLPWLSTSREHSLMFSLTSYTNRLAVTLFCRIFSGEGTIGYIGCDSTEQKRSKARAATLIGILPSLGEEEGRGFMFCTLMEAYNDLLYVWFQQRCSTAS